MAKIETAEYTNESFKASVLRLSDGIVWKNAALAKSYEVNIDQYLPEIFVTANRGALTFEIIKAFHPEVLRSIGVVEDMIDACASNKKLIPMNLRKAAVEEYQKALCMINPETGRHGYLTTGENPRWVSIYEEPNNYYRMLNGLPDDGSLNIVYNTDVRWRTDIPVHELPLVDRLDMENAGILDKLLKENPSAKYIKYCGSKMINIYKARSANRFEILWRNTIQSVTQSTLEEDFDSVYQSCCSLVNSVYYTDAFRKTNSLYDNFLAMCILFMTIQTLQYHYLAVDTTRDFYDAQSVKYVYDSYSVPFYNEIPLDTHRKIVKNINKLIGYKGSSQVFFDLFDIFNVDMDIYTYYMTKVHKFDIDGNPTFIIKEDEHGNPMYDENGKPILDSSNYDIAFSRAAIYQDPSLSIADPVNRTSYEEITINDPYWIDDANMKETLSNMEMNFNESKYIGIQTTFDLIRIAYESSYIFKMIMDNKEITNMLMINFIELNLEASFFQVFVYMAALICRRNGFDGSISSQMPFTSKIIGYDFQQDLLNLKKYITTNPYTKNNVELQNLVLNMNITNLNSVNTIFGRIYDIEKILTDGYINATSREEFETYKNLYNTLMTSSMVESVYTVGDGSVAESFESLLRYAAPELYTRYLGLTEQESINQELIVFIDKLDDFVTNLKYEPQSLGMGTSKVIDNLFRIVKFFKSAKAEIIGYNVIYKITSRGVNFFKVMDEFERCHTQYNTVDDTYVYDFFTYYKLLLKFKNDTIKMHLNLEDSCYLLSFEDRIRWINDQINITFQSFPMMIDEIKWTDFITRVRESIKLSEYHLNNDVVELIDMVFIKGASVAIFNDVQEFIDFIITGFGATYISSEMTFDNKIVHIVEDVIDFFKLNDENIVQYDEIVSIFSKIVTERIGEYLLKEHSAHYIDAKYSDGSMNDYIMTLIHQVINDYSAYYGLPNMVICNRAQYNYVINQSIPQTDELDLIDEVIVRDLDEFEIIFKDPHIMHDIFITNIGETYLQSDMDIGDKIHHIIEDIVDIFKLNDRSIMQNDYLRISDTNFISTEMEIQVLNELSRAFTDVMIHTNLNLVDKVITSNAVYHHNDIANDSGIPGYEALDEIYNNSEVLVKVLASLSDSITMIDGKAL